MWTSLLRLAVMAGITVASSALARDGDLVDNFGAGGLARMGYTNAIGNYGSAALVGAGGTITYCATRGILHHGDFVVARVLADGSPDFSFSTDGRVTIDIGNDTDDECRAIMPMPDGGMVVAGTSFDGSHRSMALVRLRANGAFETAFGVNGRQLLQFDVFGLTNAAATAVAPGPGGTIVIGGSAETIGDSRMVVARLLADGSYDGSFTLTGRQQVVFDHPASAAAMRIDASGRIVLAGRSTANFGDGHYNVDFAVARLLADGTPDTAFGDDGRTTVAFDFGGASGTNEDDASALAIQPDGKLVLAGTVDVSGTAQPNDDFAVVRLQANGAIDTGFGTGGRVIVPFDRSPSGSDVAQAVLLDAGRIVVAGYAIDDAPSIDVALLRLRPDGSRDPSFGTLGRKIVDFGFAGAGQLAFGLGAAGNRLYVTGALTPSTSAEDAYVAAFESDVLFADGFE